MSEQTDGISLTPDPARAARYEIAKGDRVRILQGDGDVIVRVTDVQEPDDDHPTDPTTLTVETT